MRQINAGATAEIEHLPVDLIELGAVLNEDRLSDVRVVSNEAQRPWRCVQVEYLGSKGEELFVLPAIHVVTQVNRRALEPEVSLLEHRQKDLSLLPIPESGREQGYATNIQRLERLDLGTPVVAA